MRRHTMKENLVSAGIGIALGLLLTAVTVPARKAEQEHRQEIAMEVYAAQEEAERLYQEEVEAEKKRWEEIELDPYAYIEEDSDTPFNSFDYDIEEKYLLAKIAMAEAGTLSTESKALVINVVLNRVRSERFPCTVEEVIYEPKQFTPIWDGRWDSVEPNQDCYDAVSMVEEGWDKSQGATFFELTRDYETWHSRNLEKLFELEGTTFYKEKEVVSLDTAN